MGKGPTVEDEMEIIRSKGITQLMIQELGLEYNTLLKQGAIYRDVYGKEPLRLLFPPQFFQELKGSFQMDLTKKGPFKLVLCLKITYVKQKLIRWILSLLLNHL